MMQITQQQLIFYLLRLNARDRSLSALNLGRYRYHRDWVFQFVEGKSIRMYIGPAIECELTREKWSEERDELVAGASVIAGR